MQGCHEVWDHIRGDVPTGSQLALHITMAFASQKGWCLEGYDAASAYLQAEGLDRFLLLRMPAQGPPPGTLPSQILRASSAIYGTRDAGRSWYLHLKKVLETENLTEMQLERCLYVYCDRDRNLAVTVFTDVDDFIISRMEQCPGFDKVRDHLVKTLHLERKDGDVWTYCGKTIAVTPSAYLVSNQTRRPSCPSRTSIDRARRAHDDDPVTEEERTAYRSAIGSLSYLTLWTRGDLQAAVAPAAQKTTRTTVGDLRIVNKILEEAIKTRDLQLTFRRATCEVAKATIVAWGDSAFANAEGEKSQCGVVVGLTERPDEVINEMQFQHCIPMEWRSATVKRVVRSTLAAESYAVSETTETAQWLQQVLAEILRSGRGPIDLREMEKGDVALPVRLQTDSENLAQSIRKDAGQVQDKRLRIVISMLRQVVATMSRRRPANMVIQWIPAWKMVADALTKLMQASMLRAFLSATPFKATPTPARSAASVATLALGALASLPGARAETLEHNYPGYILLPTWTAITLIGLILLGCLIVGCACGMLAATSWFLPALRPAAIENRMTELPSPQEGDADPDESSSLAPEGEAPLTDMPRVDSASTPTSSRSRADPKKGAHRSALLVGAVRAVPSNTNAPKTAPRCPVCDDAMIMKPSANGGRFWGCSRWPQCHGSRRPFGSDG